MHAGGYLAALWGFIWNKDCVADSNLENAWQLCMNLWISCSTSTRLTVKSVNLIVFTRLLGLLIIQTTDSKPQIKG